MRVRMSKDEVSKDEVSRVEDEEVLERKCVVIL